MYDGQQWDTPRVDIGYARVSTGPQDLTRQLETLKAAGIPEERIYVDKRTGANVDREGLRAALDYARPGDRITVCTLDRLARNMRDTLNLVHDLTERGIGIRVLNPEMDTSGDNPMARMMLMVISLLAEMELIWNRERVASARAKAGKSPGRPRTLTPERVEFARRAIANGDSLRKTAQAMGVPKSTLARALAEVTA
jgi:DNA invertase Pin-like site-specific DNA recombinase